jgi:AcrR family transcriptional regulator
LTHGAQAFTLEAVAHQAGVSKGGLLYHFTSKRALVVGMVDRLIGQFNASLATAGTEPGAATRAYLAATVESRHTEANSAADRTTVALFAAALVEPGTLAPLRESYQAWQQRLERDGLDPAISTVVRLAVDGWWLARLLDLAPPSPDLHEQVHAVLVDLIGPPR